MPSSRRGSAVFVWADRALFVGDRSETAVHSHNAIELCIGLDELGIRMSSPDDGAALEGAPGVIVRSDARHRLSIPGPKVAVLYVDPRAPVAAGLHAWIGERAIAALPDDLVLAHRGAFRDLFRIDRGLEHAGEACAALVRGLAPEPPRPRVDRRVRAALELVDGRLDRPPTLAEAAAHAGLSASRLGHLFKAEVGLPLRRYVLWMRLRDALTRALGGASMTEAAVGAGFADAAHFTRTCRRMFGLPPSAFAPVDELFIAS